MKKTIMVGSIIACFLMLMIPNISAVEYTTAESLLKEKIITSNENQIIDFNKRISNTNSKIIVNNILSIIQTLQNNFFNKILTIFVIIYSIITTIIGVIISSYLSDYGLSIWSELMTNFIGPEGPQNIIELMISMISLVFILELSSFISLAPYILMYSLLVKKGVDSKIIFFYIAAGTITDFIMIILEKLNIFNPIKANLVSN
jgi:hypothetical protein